MTRFYLTNVAAPYDPPLVAVADAAGDWDKAGSICTKLSQIPEGASASSTLSVGSTVADYDVLHRRFVSDALTAVGTIAGTVEWAIRYREDNAGLNAYWHVHVYVTVGDSNVPRGHLVVDNIGTTELSTVTPPPTMQSGVLNVSPVAVQVGDRIVLELGYRASSTLSTYLGSLYRGGTGADAAAGDTDTNRPLWLNLTGLSALAPVAPAQGELLLAGVSALVPTGQAVGQGETDVAAGSVLDSTGHAVGLGSSELAAGSALDSTGAVGALADFAAGSALELTGNTIGGAGEVQLAAGSALEMTGSAPSQGAMTFAVGSALDSTGVARPVPPYDLVEFVALNPDGSVRCPLPDVQTWGLSPILNESGAVTLTYPANGLNFAVLHENVTLDRDLLVRVVVGGIVQPELQGILSAASGDDIDPEAVWSFSGNFTEQWLTEAVVVPDGGQPSQEIAEGQNDTHFYSCTAGTILRTLLAEAVARGALLQLAWGSFSNTTDSAGVAWSRIITVKFSPGLTFLAVAQALAEYGMCEFEVVGNELRVYEGETHSVDRTLTDPPVVFRAGRDLSDSPRTHTVRDAATTLLVAGGDGVYQTVSDATALARRGRRIEAFSSQQNITDPGTLAAYSQHALELLVSGTMEKSHGLSLSGGPLPLIDFDVGDWVWSDVGAGLERLRVKNWALTGDQDGKLAGIVVLNDLIAAQEAALVRRIKGIEGGSTVTGTSQARPVPDNLIDSVAPKAPAGLVITSLAYLTNGIIESAAAAQWTAVTLNADNTAVDDLDYYVLQWRYSSPLKANIVNGVSLWKLGGIPTEPAFSWSGLAPGEQIEVRVAARDKAGNYAPYSPIVLHTLASDTDPPPILSTPITSDLFGSTRVEWNGLGSFGEVMPGDFLRAQVHASAQSGFDCTPATLYTTMSGPGVTSYSAAPYGTTMYFRLVAEDRSGNVSAASAQASGTARQAVQADVFDGAIGSSKLADLAVVRAKIADLAVNSAKIADLTVGKLTAGTLGVDVVIGANFATALSGGRVGFNPSEFFAYDLAGIQTVRISNNGSAMFMGEIKTRETGARFVFNPGGTAPTELRIFPNTGSANYTRVTAGTVTDGFGGEHSLLRILGDRYQGDIGEPYLEMFGTRGTLGWGDTALAATSHYARITADRYGPRIYGSVIRLTCENRDTITPDDFVEINFAGGGGVDIMKSLIPGDEATSQLIRGSNRGVLFHSFGISSRNRSDTTDSAMYATAFNVSSARQRKTDILPVRDSVVASFDAATGSAWRYQDDVTEEGEAAWWHIGPMAEDLPVEFQKPGTGAGPYTNIDDKVGIMWEILRRTRQQLKTVEGRLRTVEGRP